MMNMNDPLGKSKRIIILIITAMMAFFMMACAREIPQEMTLIRDGLVYVRGEKTPFSGWIVGQARTGYRRNTCRFKMAYKDGMLNGKSYFWYPNGKLESAEPYKDGQLEGIVTRYYDSGKVKAKIHFVHGMRGGFKGEIFWDENGNRL
jgi:hypothetical protein